MSEFTENGCDKHPDDLGTELCWDCLCTERKELEEWRSGKRRVFWRVYMPHGYHDCLSLKWAYAHWNVGFRFDAQSIHGDKPLGIYRVTKRPKGAKR